MVDGLTIGVAQLNPHLGDVEGNARKLLACYGKAQKLGVDVVLGTELFLTGYPPEDLVLRPAFCERVEVAARRLVAEVKEGMPALIFGLAFRREGGLYNGVVVAQNGRAVWRAKHHLPNYAVFDEKRVFVFCAFA